MALYDILLAQKLGGSNASKSMISDAYDSTKTYAVGDYCIYNNTLYICKTAITTAEEWTPAHWDATNCTTELSELKGTLTYNTLQQPTTVANVLVADGGYCKVGNIVVVNIRFNATEDIPVSSIIATNLPKPVYKNGMNYVQVYLSASKIAFIDSNGNLNLSAGVTLTQGETVFAHTVYMTY